MKFDSTITEADFKRPLLDAREASYLRQARGEPDLAVDGLSGSVLGWLVSLFAPRRR